MNCRDRIKELLRYMPENIFSILDKTLGMFGDITEEIRFRIGKPIVVTTHHGSFALLADGNPTSSSLTAYITTENDLKSIFQLVCENSIYAYLEQIKEGFITIKGGNRVGITGKVISSNGNIDNIRDISSLNFRISREVLGSADAIIKEIIRNGTVESTLFISPPKGGKTTVIRDISRQLSNLSYKIGIVDERSEIAATWKGMPQNDVGINTDVLDSVSKSLGIIMLIRSMSPDVIITDEISKSKDIEAVSEADSSGVTIIATAHATSVEDLRKREISKLIENHIFKKIVIIEKFENKLKFKINT